MHSFLKSLGRFTGMHGLLEAAVYENALWCDAVCEAHGGPGEFLDNLWLNLHGAPRFYPDAITLKPSHGTSGQKAAIADLVKVPSKVGWAVKDSFQSLDLSDLGLKPLFDAEWIVAPAAFNAEFSAHRDLIWRRIETGEELLFWEDTWADGGIDPADSRTFMPSLLTKNGIRFVSAFSNDRLVAGGVLSTGAGVIGISNVFAKGIGLEDALQGLTRFARGISTNLSVVSYDSGNALAAAHRLGFETMGHLRVWHGSSSNG
jgi:hypothetical protein